MYLLALCSTFILGLAAQQAPNTILNPGANSVIQAGGGVQSITWTNPSSGNVSLALYSGTNPVVTVASLASSIANTGTYLWTPETWLPSGNDYTIGVTDVSGSVTTQYSPYFTIELCSTCSSSTRSTTTSFSAHTVSVSGLDIGTRSNFAYPTIAAAISAASGSGVSSGVANTASGSSASVATSVPNLVGASVASQASAVGASANAVLSQTGSNAPAATASSTTKATSDSHKVQVGSLVLSGMLFALL